jgi:cytochrome P450
MTHSVLSPSIPRLRSGKLLGHALALRDDPLGTLLNALRETLRLYPPAYVITRNTREPMTLGGMRLKAGDKIFLSTFGVHRRPDLYPDPERFLPERFLDGAERTWPRSAYAPFGAGPRVCVGNHFAMMEGQLVLARLAQRLVLEHCVEGLPDPMPLITLRPKQRISMRVVPRRSQVAG